MSSGSNNQQLAVWTTLPRGVLRFRGAWATRTVRNRLACRSLRPDLMQWMVYGTRVACSMTKALGPQLSMRAASEAARR